jgi:DNA-binding NtrC family response regulator
MKERYFKTRSEFAKELNIDRKTLYNRLKDKSILLDSGKISPEDQKMIIKALKSK